MVKWAKAVTSKLHCRRKTYFWPHEIRAEIEETRYIHEFWTFTLKIICFKIWKGVSFSSKWPGLVRCSQIKGQPFLHYAYKESITPKYVCCGRLRELFSPNWAKLHTTVVYRPLGSPVFRLRLVGIRLFLAISISLSQRPHDLSLVKYSNKQNIQLITTFVYLLYRTSSFLIIE